MKKAIFFFAFFLAIGIVSADAQCSSAATAGKSCCANKAAKAASADASIEKRLADDGSISYVRKVADAQGSVQFVSVQYDEAAGAFVNVAPKTATAGATEGMVKKSCSAGEKKACCAGGASAAGKACCAKPSAGCDKKAQ
ncbi:MAG: hypothetical protein KA138_01665 [Saprospiraceae bacterium]|jgi:hypothetical protein|nr:hypothetical protein [Saprospiraceae bacterium]